MSDHYNSPEIDAAAAAVIAASEAFGITRADVLALVCQRFGEKLAQPDTAADLEAALAELEGR